MNSDVANNDRIAIVSGCSSGIGRACALRLRDEGVRVIGLDRRPADLDIEFVEVDLADSDSIARAVDRLPARVDALLDVAGVSAGIGDPRLVVSINFAGTRELTEAIVPRMPENSYIVIAASLAAVDHRAHREATDALVTATSRAEVLSWCEEHPDELGGGYALSKEALVAYVARQAVPLAARGIRINATAPGVTETPILEASVAALGQSYLDAIPKPLGRSATADEQARVLVFLAGDGAAYLSGQTLWVDGGYTAGIEAGFYPPMAARR